MPDFRHETLFTFFRLLFCCCLLCCAWRNEDFGQNCGLVLVDGVMLLMTFILPNSQGFASHQSASKARGGELERKRKKRKGEEKKKKTQKRGETTERENRIETRRAPWKAARLAKNKFGCLLNHASFDSISILESYLRYCVNDAVPSHLRTRSSHRDISTPYLLAWNLLDVLYPIDIVRVIHHQGPSTTSTTDDT